MIKKALACSVAYVLITSGTWSAQAADWPAFRGPAGNGMSPETAAPLRWDATTNVKWKAPLPRPANGSPIVSNGRVFVTSAEDDDGRLRSLYCFDRQTGEQLWKHTVQIDKTLPTHKTNPYCGTTPAANGERVVVWHASAGLHCLDFNGQVMWSRDLGEFRHMWGYGTSPVLHGDKVLLHSGPGERIFVAAFNLADGQTIWETEEPQQGTSDTREDGKYKGSWTTPLIAEVNGQDQIICPMPYRVVAYDPDDGKVIWSCEGLRHEGGDLAYSSPVVADDICVVIGGFRGPGLGIRLGVTGDLTQTARVWRNERNPQSIGSGVVVDGYMYRPNAEPGTIDCLDPKTGKVLWQDRAAGSVNWWSIVYAAGRCYLTNQEGTTVVFKPTPDKCQILAENRLGDSTNSTPAVSNGEIFIRTSQHVWCIAE